MVANNKAGQTKWKRKNPNHKHITALEWFLESTELQNKNMLFFSPNQRQLFTSRVILKKAPQMFLPVWLTFTHALYPIYYYTSSLAYTYWHSLMFLNCFYKVLARSFSWTYIGYNHTLHLMHRSLLMLGLLSLLHPFEEAKGTHSADTHSENASLLFPTTVHAQKQRIIV